MTAIPQDRRHTEPDRRRRHRRIVDSSRAGTLFVAPKKVTAPQVKAACSQCSLHELCLAEGLGELDLARVDEIVQKRQRVLRHQKLYSAGDPFHSIYAVRTGFFKTEGLLGDGREQVTGFQMGGELLGLDGISGDKHVCTAVALEDSEVCVIPFDQMQALSRSVPALQQSFHRIMSRELVQDRNLMVLLGGSRAEERIAAFLLNLSRRLSQRGYASSEFVLRMTREEIGSYLGLKLETVSRTLSKLHKQGLIEVQQRHVRLVDVEALRRISHCED